MNKQTVKRATKKMYYHEQSSSPLVVNLGKATTMTLGRGNLGHERQGHFFTYPK